MSQGIFSPLLLPQPNELSSLFLLSSLTDQHVYLETKEQVEGFWCFCSEDILNIFFLTLADSHLYIPTAK
jgi:hypothetical protein